MTFNCNKFKFDLLYISFIRPVKTVGRVTYIVLVQTLNHAQSINQSVDFL